MKRIKVFSLPLITQGRLPFLSLGFHACARRDWVCDLPTKILLSANTPEISEIGSQVITDLATRDYTL